MPPAMHPANPFEQIPFADAGFADNPEPRCPCVLVLDVSGSMAGHPILELNKGLQQFKTELQTDALAEKRVEVAVVSFGGAVAVEADFQSVPFFVPMQLQANGDTPMGAALVQAIDMVQKRKQTYRANGLAYYKPWIILITDGAPTDAWQHAAAAVHYGEANKHFAFFAIGVEGADLHTLAQISVRTPLRLKGLQFREFFQWLSASMKQVSAKSPGAPNQLPPPTGWADL